MRTILCLIAVALCGIPIKGTAQKKYVKLSGRITNLHSDSLILRSVLFTKRICVNRQGFFSDTLHVEQAYCSLFYGTEYVDCYLTNGLDLGVHADAKKGKKSIRYSGRGADANNFLVSYLSIMNDTSAFKLSTIDFHKIINSYKKSLKDLLDKIKISDTIFSNLQTISADRLMAYISANYEENKYINEVLAKGKKSPRFTDYENSAGGVTSFKDLKGKYVYIDVWATWCGPCKAEIPYLKEVEAKYHGKNIAFVSISGDKMADHAIWKKMVQEKSLPGIQLIADAGFNSSFMKEYKIIAIPRFILIDPNGLIISANAPKPSERKLIELFNALKM